MSTSEKTRQVRAIGAAHHDGIPAEVRAHAEAFAGVEFVPIPAGPFEVADDEVDSQERNGPHVIQFFGKNSVEHLETVRHAVEATVHRELARHRARHLVVEHGLRRHDGLVYDEQLLCGVPVGDVGVLRKMGGGSGRDLGRSNGNHPAA